ncbi:MAG: chorismate synthase [Selenomonas ruminantium]|jgi:chorismate synthase|uniref:Chorismate synthase n=1 Tax=Selenomonas ruminantium TaxID=971 RepID=A0A927WM86_SELRU|nr:chorismate synthase [Selenomonas ruminantium]MBE6084069.1 chorismate synthase [Selenomonas ruminantium]
MSELRFMTAGESHGPRLTAILEGLPAGLKLEKEDIDKELARRQQGYGRGGRMKIETDKVEVLSGMRFHETLGGPLTLQVINKDFANWNGRMAAFGEPEGEKVTAARPGHADLTGILKYDRQDVRDILERSSARETTMRVAVGAVCKAFLQELGIKVVSHVVNIGGVAVDMSKIDMSKIGEDVGSELNCYDSEAEVKMKARIDEAKAAGDTLGGIFEVIVQGAPVGLGSHIQWDRRLDARLSAAMMSIQAIKGVEIGAGFACAVLPGSQIHDEIFLADGRVQRKTNRAGGLEGGMTNGEDIVLRAAMKPIPTLMTPLNSIDIESREAVLACKERSDTCAVSAASVVGEAMTAFVVAQAICEKFGGDALTDVKAAMAAYNKRIGKDWCAHA